MASSYSDIVYSGILSTTLTSLSTTPASATFVCKGFWVSNSDSEGRKAEIQFDGKRYMPYLNDIPAGDVMNASPLDIPLLTTVNIKGRAEVATLMDYYIYGIEEVTT